MCSVKGCVHTHAGGVWGWPAAWLLHRCRHLPGQKMLTAWRPASPLSSHPRPHHLAKERTPSAKCRCVCLSHTLCTHTCKNIQTYINIQANTNTTCTCNGAHAHACTHVQTDTHSLHRCISTSTRACAQAVPSGAVPPVGIKTPHDSCHTWNDYKSLGIE